MENEKNILVAPKGDTVNVMWRSQAKDIMLAAGANVRNEQISLGRLTITDYEKFPKVGGYVLFYAFVHKNDFLPGSQLAKQAAQENEEGEYVVVVKAFHNEKKKTRKAILLPKKTLVKVMEFHPGNCFKAIINTSWRYAPRGGDCQILREDDYQKEKKE